MGKTWGDVAEIRFNLRATMITTTTYGTWLPGDLRGYVEDGVVLPGDPAKLERAGKLLRGSPVFLTPEEQDAAFAAACDAVREFGYELHAVSVESWHTHILVTHGAVKVAAVAGQFKTRMRQAIAEATGRTGRIWTTGYDKRFCFNDADIAARHDYIRRHAGYRPIDPSH